MDSTKQCANGHRYRSDLPECPFCPKGDRTVVDNPNAPEEPFSPSAGSFGDRRTQMDDSAPPIHSPGDISGRKTQIAAPDRDAERFGSPAPSTTGKLIGWLVTFTWNPLGEDYRLREGKTRIGTTPGLDIVLPDGRVSADHALLLYRSGQLHIGDNRSTNGTLVNGEDIGFDLHALKDGDQITVGQTVFKLRLIP